MLTLDKIYHAAFVLKDIARKTDLIAAPQLCEGSEVYLKTENLQVTGSFKVRGAYYKISQLTQEDREKGVIACSAGNHAQGVALAATKMGIKSIICMPDGAPIMKVENTKRLGADDAFDTHFSSGKSNALSVVACTASDYAFFTFFLGKLANFIVSTAHFKAAGYLQVFGF